MTNHKLISRRATFFRRPWINAAAALLLALVLALHPVIAVLADDTPATDTSTTTTDQSVITDSSTTPSGTDSGTPPATDSNASSTDNQAPTGQSTTTDDSTGTPPSDPIIDQSASTTTSTDAVLPDVLAGDQATTSSSTDPSVTTTDNSSTTPPSGPDPVVPTGTTDSALQPGSGSVTNNAIVLDVPCTAPTPDASSSPDQDTATSATSSIVVLDAPVNPCAPADATSTVTSTSTVSIINQNQATVENNVVGTSDTGSNVIVTSTSNDSTIVTGQAHIFANVINVLNTNQVNSDINQIVQNFNSLSSNIALTMGDGSPQDWAQGLVSGLCGGMDCQSINSFLINNQNNASLTNNVFLQGNSGQNSIQGQGAVNGGSIHSGDVWAVVNILNIVNTNLVNSHWTIASINVFGNWNGDLVLPSDLYFQKYFSIGDTPDSLALPEAGNISMQINNVNNAEVTNNVAAVASSGDNQVTASSTSPSGGDMASTTVATGNVRAVANVQNTVNTNVLNGLWFLGMVNTLGSWSGGIYSLPDQVHMVNTPTGMAFLSSTGVGTSVGSSTNTDTTVTIENNNQANITNNVAVVANSGGNSVSGDSVNDTEIVTGNSTALANILNFANTNLINSNVQVGMVNIFGNWQGNVVFGYPDLAVHQFLESDFFPAASHQPVVYGVNYSNLGRSMSDDTWLEWNFDPEVMAVKDVKASVDFQILNDKIRFHVGRLNPGTGSTIEIEATTLQSLELSTPVITVAQIMAVGPELELSNNISTFRTTAAIARAPIGTTQGTYVDPLPQASGAGDGPLVVTKELVSSSTDGTEFKVTVKNEGNTTLHNVIVIDELHDASGALAFTKNFPIGDLAPHEEVAITYTLDSSQVAGSYTNTARAEARGSGGNTVTSGAAVSVPFELLAVTPDVFPEVLGMSTTTATSTAAGTVGPRIRRPQSPSEPNTVPLVTGDQTRIPQQENITEPISQVSSNHQFGWIVIGCLILALIYALVSFLERRKRAAAPAPESVPQRLKTF